MFEFTQLAVHIITPFYGLYSIDKSKVVIKQTAKTTKATFWVASAAVQAMNSDDVHVI
jgi:hypothetical protein